MMKRVKKAFKLVGVIIGMFFMGIFLSTTVILLEINKILGHLFSYIKRLFKK